MTIDEAIKNLEYGIEQMTMELKSGLWETGSDTEAQVKQGIELNQQLIAWLTDYKKSQEELAEAKRLLKLAICELGDAQDCDSCIADCSIGTDCIYKWHCSNEALKLIES